jgi:hypothetical protein
MGCTHRYSFSMGCTHRYSIPPFQGCFIISFVPMGYTPMGYTHRYHIPPFQGCHCIGLLAL